VISNYYITIGVVMVVPQLMLFLLFNLIIPSICPSYPDDIPKNAFDFGVGTWPVKEV
jgi:hypothetical protein